VFLLLLVLDFGGSFTIEAFLETTLVSHRSLSSSIVSSLGRLRESTLVSDQLVVTTFLNSRGGRLRELRLHLQRMSVSTRLFQSAFLGGVPHLTNRH